MEHYAGLQARVKFLGNANRGTTAMSPGYSENNLFYYDVPATICHIYNVHLHRGVGSAIRLQETNNVSFQQCASRKVTLAWLLSKSKYRVSLGAWWGT